MSPEEIAELLGKYATPEELAEYHRISAPIKIPYCPWTPYPKQQVFLGLNNVKEVLYGGSAGAAKSVALLMAALQYVEQPNYHALILRRTFAQLAKADSILELSKEWMIKTDAVWNQSNKKWTFPSGATLEFGHMDEENSKYNYQGPAFQFVGFDELTQFTETMYTYLFSRMRKRIESAGIPIRMRVTANPGGIGHVWVKERFIEPKKPKPGRVWVQASREDNFGLDHASYDEMLKELDPITRKQLAEGDWNAYEGGRFKREWFRHKYRKTPTAYFLTVNGKDQEWSKRQCSHFTICDPAATVENSSDPTAIAAFALTPKRQLLVLEVVRDWIPLEGIMPIVRDVAVNNGSDYVGVEAVNFQVGLIHSGRQIPNMPPVRAVSASVQRINYQKGEKGKLVRATQAIVMAEGGQIFLPTQAAWLEDFVAELVLFTGDDKKDAYDDQVDCLSYGVLQINFSLPVEDEKKPDEEEFDLRGMPSRRLVPHGDSPYFRRR